MHKKVQLPGMRVDLIGQIQDLSDFEMQKKKWVDPTHPCRFSAKMGYPIDAILDELSMHEEDYESNVGWTLRHINEAKKVHRVANALHKVTHTIGYNQPDSAYINSPLWQDVVSKAKIAYDVLMEDEDLDDLLRQEAARVVD